MLQDKIAEFSSAENSLSFIVKVSLAGTVLYSPGQTASYSAITTFLLNESPKNILGS